MWGKKIKIKHTPSFTPHLEISYLLIMYREDLVLTKERIVISTISMQTVPELPLEAMS